MRRLADRERIERFLRALGGEATREARLYLTGGATAVLLGWRQATLDVDLALEPQEDRVLRALPRLKESLELNVELASPADFIPALPGWAERSRFIAQEGHLAVFHYDLYAQALAKLERAHTQDLGDVRELLGRGLVAPEELWRLFRAIEPHLYRFPAIDPETFRARVQGATRPAGG
jgi:hypothetical protein